MVTERLSELVFETAYQLKMKLDDWRAQYQAKCGRLGEFDAGIEAKLKGALSRRWHLASHEESSQCLTERQRNWETLRYYFECIANSGDIFACLNLIYGEAEAFRAIGATKTLATARSLRSYHEAYQALGSQDEKDEFWRETQSERLPIQKGADNLLEFADLLIAFAESHPEDFTPLPPADPFANLSEHIDTLKEEILSRKSRE